MTAEYARALGHRLRSVRTLANLSLSAVEEKSLGAWKAVVVGSYERGDRAITVVNLVGLADFYGVQVTDLLPDISARSGRATSALVLDLSRMADIPVARGGALQRFAAAIQLQRKDYDGKVLSIRIEDLKSLAVMYGLSPRQLADQLISWGVLPEGTDVE